MKTLATLLLGSLPTLASSCQPIVIQHSMVPNSDQPSYILTVNDTDPHLATVANGGYVQNSNGNDVVFASDSRGQNLLSWDPFEVYNPVTGQLATHVQVGTVSHVTDTTIYRCAGNPIISSFQGGTTGPVWPLAYLGVYHLGNGTVLSAADSSLNANNGTVTGAVATTGKIDGAASIVGTSDRISLPDTIGFPFSIEAWINVSSTAASRSIAFMAGSFNYTYLSVDPGGHLAASYGGGCASTPNVLAPASWQYVAVTFAGPGGPCVLYVNGVQVAAGTMIAQSPGTTAPITLGSAEGSSPLAGSLDEVRIYNGAMSASRIAADYNNQFSPSTFYTPGVWTAMATRTGGSQSFVF